MDRSENYILNRLDQPLRFLGIHKDEALSLLCPLIGGLFMGWFLTGFVAGIGSLSLLRSLKKRNAGSSLVHAMYWHLPTSQHVMKLYVPSHIREMIG
ncbi:MAG: type IV conjugative transfer system protein TraL [Alphaproteobacteria bacterium 41-28]|nr:MAG: type IV conjugative transfer system protein TraL [Alphaproteobacteria bacterium 41-28]